MCAHIYCVALVKLLLYSIDCVCRFFGTCFRKRAGICNDCSSGTHWYHDKYSIADGGYSPSVSDNLVNHTEVGTCVSILIPTSFFNF